MSQYATTAEMFRYLEQVDQTPENEQLFTELLERASSLIDELLYDLDAVMLTASRTVNQLCLEIAVNYWRQRDRGMWAPSSGVEGEGILMYTGVLTEKQESLIRQIRIRGGAIAL
jgi:hypothetical protein